MGVALLHLHEKGLVHMDFGAHNVGKVCVCVCFFQEIDYVMCVFFLTNLQFRNQWKVLGIGGSISIGKMTDPSRGL